MSRRTHIAQMNGSSRGPLVDSIRPYVDQIRFSLGRMNGSSFWAYSLWRAPDGADLLADIPLSEDYLQSAGTADAMTVEVRVVDADGTAHQFTVGKSGGDPAAGRTEIIRWDDGHHSTTVHPHEVFTADEAADIFHAYFVTDEIPAPYVLRELDLNAAKELGARELIFSDENGAEETWLPGGERSAADAFWEFVEQHGRDDNLTFSIEDDENSEALLLMLGQQIVCRATSEPSVRGEYCLVTDDDYLTQVDNFVRGGFAALDEDGPWWPDVASLMGARLGFELPEGSRLAKALARAGLAERWYRWCDRSYDWSAEATGEYEPDSLLTAHGGFAALTIDEFMQAYSAAGGTVTRGTTCNNDPKQRSFTIEVTDGRTVGRLEIRLGRGLNSQDCMLSVLVDGEQDGDEESLTTVAHKIVQARGETVPHPEAPYPRPIISSRSHLEVSAREIVAMMTEVVRAW